MFGWLGHIISRIIKRKKSSINKVNQKENIQKTYPTQKVAFPYALIAILIFGFQGLVAVLGAIELTMPDIPGPIRVEVGRAIHLSLSVYWPLLGSMGIVYFFFIQEAETDLYSSKLALGQLGILVLTGVGIIVSLLLSYFKGTEYRESGWYFDVFIALVFVIFIYNLIRTYFKPKVPQGRITLLVMLLGSILLLVLYIPNIYSYVHPTTNEIVRFWVVHMWEELSKELLIFAILVAFILSVSDADRKLLEKILFIQVILLIISATFATGHHYYWIGTPAIWLWIGGIFSVIQVIAIFFIVFIVYYGVRSIVWKEHDSGTKIAFGFIISSVIHHIAGAAVLGLIIAIPQLNRFCHGTYLTSSHAHLALFGAIGLFVLGCCTYILTRGNSFSLWEGYLGWLGLILLNTGLITMGSALAIAGILQTYLWRVAGVDFMAVHMLIQPHLLVRVVGGVLFALGDLCYLWAHISVLGRKIKVFKFELFEGIGGKK